MKISKILYNTEVGFGSRDVKFISILYRCIRIQSNKRTDRISKRIERFLLKIVLMKTIFVAYLMKTVIKIYILIEKPI